MYNLIMYNLIGKAELNDKQYFIINKPKLVQHHWFL